MTPLRVLVLALCALVAAFAADDGPRAPLSPSGATTEQVTEEYDPTTKAEAFAQIERSGLYLLDVESIVFHVHAELTVYVDGVEVAVPQVGVDLDTLTAAPVHTHSTDGILHIEADEAHRDVAIHLDDFLAVLGAGRDPSGICRFYLDRDTCSLNVTVDGQPAPLDVTLDDGQQIVLDVTGPVSV